MGTTVYSLVYEQSTALSHLFTNAEMVFPSPHRLYGEGGSPPP